MRSKQRIVLVNKNQEKQMNWFNKVREFGNQLDKRIDQMSTGKFVLLLLFTSILILALLIVPINSVYYWLILTLIWTILFPIIVTKLLFLREKSNNERK